MESHLMDLLKGSSVKNNDEIPKTKFKNNAEFSKRAFPLNKIKSKMFASKSQ